MSFPVERLPISVCMISGAEAARIGRALESVAAWTSEIIVVLNEEVKDGTEEIAQRHGARVFREPWKGHIEQKNSAAAKASNPWVLGLDADEAVSAELRQQIQKAFLGPDFSEPFAAFSFPRRTLYCGRWIRHGDWYPDRQVRLWKKQRAQWGGIDPHDKLLVDGRIGKLRGDLEHYSFDSINHHLQKVIGFSDEFLRQRKNDGSRVRCFALGIRPAWRFLRAYVFRLGFLDGWQGYYIAWINSFSTLTRYAKMREAQASARRAP